MRLLFLLTGFFLFSSCNSLIHKSSSSTSSNSVALGTISPDSFSSIPDWTMNFVQSCYAEELRINPNQEGEIVFSIIPPEGDGPVQAIVLENLGLSSNLAECIRSSFGSIYNYVGKGRKQIAFTDTLFLSRKIIDACPPPSTEVFGKIVTSYYKDYEVVQVTGLKILDIQHFMSEYILQRYVSLNLELTFTKDGYEGQCYHGNEYKVFSSDIIEATGAGHSCKSIFRKKGETVSDTHTIVFELEKGLWWENYDDKAFCGNNRKAFVERY